MPLYYQFHAPSSLSTYQADSRMRRRVTLLTTLLFSVMFINAQQLVTLIISDTSGPVINKNIYGQFAEHLGRCVYDGLVHDGKVRMDVVEALRKIRIVKAQHRPPREPSLELCVGKRFSDFNAKMAWLTSRQ